MQHEGIVNAVFEALGTTCALDRLSSDPLIIEGERSRIAQIIARSHDLFPSLYSEMSDDDKIDSFVGSIRRSSANGCYIPDHVVKLFTRVY